MTRQSLNRVNSSFAQHYVSVRDFGALGDGTTDDTNAIQTAIDTVAAAGGGTVFFPRGVYYLSAALTISTTQDNVRLHGEGYENSYFTKGSNDHEFIRISDPSTGWVTTESNILASDAASGDETLTLSSGKGANFTANTWAALISNAVITGTSKQAEFVHIFSVSTDTLTLSRPLRHAATTANSAEVRNVNWVTGFEMEGLGIDGNNYSTGGGNVNLNNFIECSWAYQPKFKNVGMWEGINYGLGLAGCLQAEVSNLYVTDLLSDGIQGNSGSFGYGIVELGLNEGLIVQNLTADRVRHAYTTAVILTYGEATGSKISDSVAMNCRGAGFDTHPQGREITFDNCVVLGSLAHGFQERATRTSFNGCTARDCVGVALNITSDATVTRVNNFNYLKTNLGTWNGTDWTTYPAIYDWLDGAWIDYLEDTWTPVFSDAQSGGNTAAGGTFSGIYIRTGNKVHVQFRGVNIDTTGMTPGNTLYVQGLPYVSAVNNMQNTGSCWFSSVTTTDGNLVPTVEPNGQSTVVFRNMSTTTGALLTVGALTPAAADMYGNITYEI